MSTQLPITRLDPNTRRARAVVHGNTVYLAGQTASDHTLDIAGQTQQVLAKVDEMLEAAGTDKSRLLSVTIWLSTMKNFDAMNAVYDAWTVPGHVPARACGAMELVRPAILVEIMAIAAL